MTTALPKTRAAAKLINAPKYFTGKPCKHGHGAERYTQSGTCAACLGVANTAIQQQTATSKAKLRAARASLVEIKIRAYAPDMTIIRGAALAYAKARYPELASSDVNPDKRPVDSTGGTALYRLRVPLPDISHVQAIAGVLLAAHGPDVTQVREAALSNVAQAVEVQPEPEFRP